MTTKARKLARKTQAAELDMEIMRAREANGLPVISPMLGLPREKWECEFRDYLVALGDPRVADPEWMAAGGAASRQVVREVVRCVVRGIGERVRLREGGSAAPSRTTTALATYTRRAPGSNESGPCRRRGLRRRNCGELLPLAATRGGTGDTARPRRSHRRPPVCDALCQLG